MCKHDKSHHNLQNVVNIHLLGKWTGLLHRYVETIDKIIDLYITVPKPYRVVLMNLIHHVQRLPPPPGFARRSCIPAPFRHGAVNPAVLPCAPTAGLAIMILLPQACSMKHRID